MCDRGGGSRQARGFSREKLALASDNPVQLVMVVVDCSLLFQTTSLWVETRENEGNQVFHAVSKKAFIDDK